MPVDLWLYVDVSPRSDVKRQTDILHWFQEEICLHVSLWENDPTSPLIYDLSERFLDVFEASINSFKSSLTHHDVRLVIYGPI